MDSPKRESLDIEGLKDFLKVFFQKYNLKPKSVYLVGGFARGFGKRDTPDIDILVNTGEVDGEELFKYFDAFSSSHPLQFGSYELEFHTPGGYFAPLESWEEKKRLL